MAETELVAQSAPKLLEQAGVVPRLLAKGVDLLLMIACAAILPYPLGPLMALAYSLLADALPVKGWQGQSVGKRVFHLKVIHSDSGQVCSIRDSATRNAPVGVSIFFAIIPIWGWLILFLVGTPLLVIEVYLMLSTMPRRRLGDVMADTEVRRLATSSLDQ